MSDTKTKIRYNKSILDDCLLRDKATLNEAYESLSRETKISFTCSCGTTHTKSLRLCHTAGMFCKGCMKKITAVKFQNTMVDKYGVKNPNDIPGVQEKINTTILTKYGNDARKKIAKNMILERWNKYKERFEELKKNGKMKCTKCNEEKELDQFHKSKSTSDTWFTICKLCKNTKRTANRDNTILNSSLESFLENILKDALRRDKKKERESDIDVKYLVDLWNTQAGKCYYSGRQMLYNLSRQNLPENKRIHPERVSIDRIDSAKGYIKGNIVLCCWTANNIKQDLTVEEYKKWITDIYNTFKHTKN
jgi:hypothetical protein